MVQAVSDFLSRSQPPFLLCYQAPLRISDTAYGTPILLPIDSLRIGIADTFVDPYYTWDFKGLTGGGYRPGHIPMIIWAGSNTLADRRRYKISLIKNEHHISEDTLDWISNSDSGGVHVQNVYSMDITGDGIDDLLVTDGDSIFIYNGNRNFGTYQLTRSNAYYVIPSPSHLDPRIGHLKDFGGYMRNCGDLTGSGVPVLMTTASQNDQFGNYQTYAFFYCGGKALDSLYDAEYDEPREVFFTMDTLHRINGDARTSVIFQNVERNYLIHDGAERIPHRTNPNLRGVEARPTQRFTASAEPSIASTTVRIALGGMDRPVNATIELRNVLGELVDSRSLGVIAGSQIEAFNVSALPSGIYVAEIRLGQSACAVKFVVRK